MSFMIDSVVFHVDDLYHHIHEKISFCFRKKLNVKKETDKCLEKKGMATT